MVRSRTAVATLLLAGLLILVLFVACGQEAPAKVTVSPNIDGFVFNETYTCSETPSGGAPFCADNKATDVIQFTSTGANAYEGRDVPDTGFVYTGTFSGAAFHWTAISPDGYTESGTWTFAPNGSSFSGSSHYLANNNTYQGDCNSNGARVPATPPAPAAVSPCP